MGHDWKPGTLAIVTLEDDHGPAGGPYLAFYSGLSRQWISAENGWIDTTSCRPAVRLLVVIDPEDAEQVERLARIWHITPGVTPWDELDQHDRNDSVKSLAASLCEFANPQPPKPDEPTGLGAVVVDNGGTTFVRGVFGDGRPRWVRCGDGDINTKRLYGYSEITAVRVLSEGVQP